MFSIEGVTLLGDVETTAVNGGSIHLNLSFTAISMKSKASNKGLQVGAIVFSPLAAVQQEQDQTAAAVTGGAG